MQTANGLMQINQFTQVPFKNITPAEALVLQAFHAKATGGVVFLSLNVNKEPLVTTDEDELDRLRSKYTKNKIDKLFPGVAPKLAQTFEEVKLVKPVAPKPVEQPEVVLPTPKKLTSV